MQSIVSQLLQRPAAPWLEWAKTEPMRHTIVAAMNLLDTDRDATVTFEDLQHFAQSEKHKRVVRGSAVRELFRVLESRMSDGDRALDADGLKRLLSHLSPEQLAHALAELPVALAKYPKPVALKWSEKAVASGVSDLLNGVMTEIHAAHFAPNVAENLVSVLGSTRHMVRPGGPGR